MSTPRQEAQRNAVSPQQAKRASPSSSSADSAMVTTPKLAGSSSSSSRVQFTPRRSLAHHPRLLGLEEDGRMELLGLGISSNTAAPGSTGPERPPLTNARSSSSVLFENADLADDDDNVGHAMAEGSQSNERAKTHARSHSNPRNGRPLAPIRIDSYGGLRGFQVEQDEQSTILPAKEDPGQGRQDERDLEQEAASYSLGKDADADGVEDDGDEGEEDGVRMKLMFEPTTAREKSWMWTSVALVAILTLISIGIAVDWIDWPGDGIGKD